jgi:hypothetical protein
MTLTTSARRSALIAGTSGLIGIASVLSANPAQAAVVNGDFSNGFNGWSTTGLTFTANQRAQLTTAGVLLTKPQTELESFLGLPGGTLDNVGNGDARRGSAIKQEITAKAGDVLTFSWNFLTNENTPSTRSNDFSFFTINGMFSELADTTASFSQPSFPVSLFFRNQTGFQSISYQFATAGTYTLGFGVVDVGDALVASALQIDDVQVNSIPTPALLPGLVGLGLGVLRKRKAEATAKAESELSV